MLPHNIRMAVPVALLFAPKVLAQALNDPVWDYCSGDGSICKAASELMDECNENDGEEYYECMCTSGYIPTDEMCQWCKEAGNMSPVLSDNLPNMCEAEGYEIGPVPSSIISQQEERNETTSMPEVTYTETFTYTTPDFEPWTVTIKGDGGDITLPTLPEVPTETDAASIMAETRGLLWRCVAGMAMAVALVW